MENRRDFLRKFIPRLLLLGGAFSLPSRTYGHSKAGQTRLDLSQARYTALFKELNGKYHFSEKELQSTFKKVLLQPDILEKFDRPAERLPYYTYETRFIRKDLILQSRRFMRENLSLFKKVEARYGVEKEVIGSILGIESKFGQKGLQTYRVFDVLNTIFSGYPRRERFYRGQLIELLLLSREEGIDPLEVMGSYAGAFGMPQFIPSSFRAYAVDFDQDGKRDLWNSKGDIFASVANYLSKFKWRHGGLIRLPATVPQNNVEVKQVLKGGLRSTTSASSLAAMGIKIEPPPKENEKVSLVTYQPKKGGGNYFLAVFNNFHTLTRYNYSINYALVVTELSEQIKKDSG